MLNECMPRGHVFPGHDLNSQELRNNHTHLCDILCLTKPLTQMISPEASPQPLKAGEVFLSPFVLLMRKVISEMLSDLPKNCTCK